MYFKQLALTVTALAFSGASLALPFTLTIDDTSTSGVDVTLTDTSNTGFLSYNSMIDGAISDWTVVMSSAVSNPTVSASQNEGKVFGVNTLDIAAGNGGALVITAIDYGFTDYGNLTAIATGQQVGGTVNTTASVNFGAGWVEIGSFDIGALTSESSYLSQTAVAPYDLKIVTSITLAVGGSTFLDTTINVPEPSVIALFGLGLIGIGFAGRRRQSK